MFNFDLKKTAIFFIIILAFAIGINLILVNLNSNSNNQNINSSTILKDTSNNYVKFDSINPNNNDAKIIQTKELEQKIETQTNRIIQDYLWVETNDEVSGTITLSSIGRKTFKCDGTLDNPNCFEIQTCSISKKPCYEYNNGKTIIYVNHFSGAFNTMTWTTDDDWNTGTHTNTTNSTNNLVLSGTNTTGSYTSNTTTTTYAITRIKPLWNSTDSWGYKKEINISNTGLALTNYQVNLTIIKETKINTDYSDLRFTDTSGNTIPYWIEEYNANNASIWIKTNISASTNTTILMYYDSLNNNYIDNASTVFDNYYTIPNKSYTSNTTTALWYWSHYDGGSRSQHQTEDSGQTTDITTHEGAYGAGSWTTNMYWKTTPNNIIYIYSQSEESSTNYFMHLIRIPVPADAGTIDVNYDYDLLQLSGTGNGAADVSIIIWVDTAVSDTFDWSQTIHRHTASSWQTGQVSTPSYNLNYEKNFNASNINGQDTRGKTIYIGFGHNGGSGSNANWQTTELNINMNNTYIIIRKYTATEPTISSTSSAIAGNYRGFDGQNYTVEISADAGANWITTTNNTNYTSGAGIGTGTNLLYRINFSTNDSAISPQLHDITLDYDTDMSPPTIDFVEPTKYDNEYINTNYTYINVTITDNTNTTAFIDWNNSLVGWWRFNNETSENNTYFNDWSSYENNGSCSTNTCPNYTTGKFGKGTVFDGIDDSLKIKYTTSINLGNGNLTLSAWIKTLDSNSKVILKKSNPAYPFEEYELAIMSSTQIRGCAVDCGTGACGFGSSRNCLNGNINIIDGLWHHVLYTRESTTQKIFVDSQLINSLTETAWDTDNSNDLYIGSQNHVSYNFNGTIDEVKIWNRALSPEEINASYNAGLYRLESNFTNLAEATYTYTAYAQDLAGNVNQTETRTLTIDTTAPIITINSPLNQSYNTSSIWFNITATDTNDIDWCGYTLNNAQNITMTNSSGNWNSQNTSMSDNSYSVSFSCNDTLGNMNTTTQYFTVDTTKPTIIIYEPTNTTTNDNTPHINASATDANPNKMWYSIDGGTAIYNSWSTEIDTSTTVLSDGTHYITIYANDTAGNQNSTTRYFEVDALAPEITITSPAAEFHGGDAWFKLSLDQRVSWCGYSLDSTTNITMTNTTQTNYEKFVFGLSEHTHTLVFWCNNTYGLYTSASKNFNYTAGFVTIKLVGNSFTPTNDFTDKYVSTPIGSGQITGLIHADGKFNTLSSNTNTMSINQGILSEGHTAKAYIVYTKGNINTLENRIQYIKNGQIDKMPNPSFAFGIDKKTKIQLGLEYTNIDILGNDKFGLGYYEIIIRNDGKLNQKSLVSVEKS